MLSNLFPNEVRFSGPRLLSLSDRLLLEAFEGVKFAQLDRKGGSIKAVRSDGPRKEIIV
jgi:hypothetical protein